MQVKNKSARVWTVSGVLCVPGQITEVPGGNPADVKGNPDLEVVQVQDVEFKEVKSLKKGIEQKTNTAKADLQPSQDGAE